jgi:hypothetical protein
MSSIKCCCRSQWPRGLRRGSAGARLLGLRVRIPPGAWMSVSFECCLLSGRGLCVGLITRPEESYRVLCECDREALINEEALAQSGLLNQEGGEIKYWYSELQECGCFYSVTFLKNSRNFIQIKYMM